MHHVSRSFLVLLALGVVAGSGTFWLHLDPATRSAYLSRAHDSVAAVFFSESITPEGLRATYNRASRSASAEKVKILIVAGHEPTFGGSEYKHLKERDMALAVAERLVKKLSSDPRHFEVITTRDSNGWNPLLRDYFTTQWDAIKAFRKSKKTEMDVLVNSGSVTKVIDPVPHAVAQSDVAVRLFGINKWANENGVDIMIHLHFNDYPRARQASPGKYEGFAVYVPHHQYSNARASLAFAGSIFEKLIERVPVSTWPQESSGIVPDQELIALGVNNTADAVSVLIEYGYIYESRFSTPEKLANETELLADATYRGVKDFFEVQ